MNRVNELLSQTIDLLNECGWHDKAEWYRQVKEDLNTADPASPQFKEQIEKLDKSLCGMGAFSDIPLQSQSGKLSLQEIRDLQWKLVDELGQAIVNLR